MDHDIHVTTTQAQPYIGITATTSVGAIGRTLGEIYGELMAHMGRHGIEPVAPPFALYERMEDDGAVELTGGVLIDGDAPVTGRIHEGSLPGGEAATTTHFGPYDTLHETVAALAAWIEEKGRRPRGAHWEHYVDDPAETPPGKLRTVLYWPLA